MEYIAKLRERKFYERHKRRQARKDSLIRGNVVRNQRRELKNEQLSQDG